MKSYYLEILVCINLLCLMNLVSYNFAMHSPIVTPITGIPSRLAFISEILTTKRHASALSDQQSSPQNGPKKNAFLFPGQGAQFIGMGVQSTENLPAARSLFDQANHILGYDLYDLCKNGPKNVLDTTEIAQPAIFVCSMAAVERWKSESGYTEVVPNDLAMGLSLGEYSALCFAGVLSFEDALKIVQERGKAMQVAAESSDSGMVAILGLPSEKVEEICKYVHNETLESINLANYLSPGNYVVSGSTKACDMVEKIAKPQFRALKAVRLPVAGAFHTQFMKPAAERLRKILQNTKFNKPKIEVISNVDAESHYNPDEIKEALLKQLTEPVQLEKSMRKVSQMGFDNFYELGPGTVLTGIMKRINKNILVQPFQ